MDQTIETPAPELAPAAPAEPEAQPKPLRIGVHANTKENAVELQIGQGALRLDPETAKQLANHLWQKAIEVQRFAKEAKRTRRGKR